MLIYGSIYSSNSNGDQINLIVHDHQKNEYNIKTTQEVFATLRQNYIYGFLLEMEYGKRTKLNLVKIVSINDLNYLDRYAILKDYVKVTDYEPQVLASKVYSFLDSIQHEELKLLCKTLITDHEDDYFTYPAGFRMHHAYIGGLAVHTLRMLELSESFTAMYPVLNRDLVVAGLLLHDLCKIYEYDDLQTMNFTKEANLLGHLVMASNLIEQYRLRLNLKDTETLTYLKHIILAHHGELEYGSPKKPFLFEALVVAKLDELNSKFDTLSDTLVNLTPGEVSESIPALGRLRFLRH